ncbi:MAG: hypothetical protein QOG28_6851 [Trebonia sp.]|nr:hypothetical protein [Trebonia sp.]
MPAGGRLLFGDCYWETAPSAAATEMFGEQVLPLAGLLEACRSAGWRVIHMSVASRLEWDDFESTFRAGRQEWLVAHAGDPRAAGGRLGTLRCDQTSTIFETWPGRQRPGWAGLVIR